MFVSARLLTQVVAFRLLKRTLRRDTGNWTGPCRGDAAGLARGWLGTAPVSRGLLGDRPIMDADRGSAGGQPAQRGAKVVEVPDAGWAAGFSGGGTGPSGVDQGLFQGLLAGL